MHVGEQSLQLPRAETIRAAKVAAHKASGFGAFSASNYLEDHTFRKPSDIWLQINLLFRGFTIFLFTTYRVVPLHHLL